MLGTCVVSRRDFDNIGTDNVEAVEAADNGSKFSGTPAARFWGACGWRECRVERVDIDGDVDGIISDSVSDLFDDSVDAYVGC